MDRRPPQPQPLALPAAEPLPHAPGKAVAAAGSAAALASLTLSRSRYSVTSSIAPRSWRQLQSIRRRVCLPMAPGGKAALPGVARQKKLWRQSYNELALPHVLEISTC